MNASGGIVRNGFAGPGGWCVALQRLRLGPSFGIEMDAAACATRRAARHLTVRADMSQFPVDRLPGRITGSVDSPVCITFSQAGKRGGVAITDALDASIRDLFAGKKTRAARRREMAAVLAGKWWPSAKLTRAERSAKIWAAVRSASLVVEPAGSSTPAARNGSRSSRSPRCCRCGRRTRTNSPSSATRRCGVLNAADYGVPQVRERAILVASRCDRMRRPEPTDYHPRRGMQLLTPRVPWPTLSAGA